MIATAIDCKTSTCGKKKLTSKVTAEYTRSDTRISFNAFDLPVA